MACKNPRLTITIPAEAYANLQRFAELSHRPVAGVLRELSQPVWDVLPHLVAALEAQTAIQSQALAVLEGKVQQAQPVLADLQKSLGELAKS